jgi:hypothetical protein
MGSCREASEVGGVSKKNRAELGEDLELKMSSNNLDLKESRDSNPLASGSEKSQTQDGSAEASRIQAGSEGIVEDKRPGHNSSQPPKCAKQMVECCTTALLPLVAKSAAAGRASSSKGSPSGERRPPEGSLEHFFNLVYPTSQVAPAPGVDPRGAFRSNVAAPKSSAPIGPPWQWFPKQGRLVSPPEAPGGEKDVTEQLERSQEELLKERVAISTSPADLDRQADYCWPSPQVETLDLPGGGGQVGGQEGGGVRSLEDLPRVLLLAVLGHLPRPRDILAFAATSRAAKEVASNPGLWTAFFIKRCGPPSLVRAHDAPCCDLPLLFPSLFSDFTFPSCRLHC